MGSCYEREKDRCGGVSEGRAGECEMRSIYLLGCFPWAVETDNIKTARMIFLKRRGESVRWPKIHREVSIVKRCHCCCCCSRETLFYHFIVASVAVKCLTCFSMIPELAKCSLMQPPIPAWRPKSQTNPPKICHLMEETKMH